MARVAKQVKSVPLEAKTVIGIIGFLASRASTKTKSITTARPTAIGTYWMCGEESPKSTRTMEVICNVCVSGKI